MTIFVDASAIVAMTALEADYEVLGRRLDEHADRRTSAIALWESTLALSRLRNATLRAAEDDIRAFLSARRIVIMPIGSDEGSLALTAHARFGKRVHAAKLNMGDCFSYACTQAADAILLYKGDDFSKTDLA